MRRLYGMDRGRQIAALKVRRFEGRITVAPALHISLGVVCGYTRGGIAGSVQAGRLHKGGLDGGRGANQCAGSAAEGEGKRGAAGVCV